MRLDFAFFADAAQFTPDGRLWVIGGSLDNAKVASVPYTHPAIAVVVKVWVALEECDQEHTIHFHAEEPGGNTFIRGISASLTPKVAEDYPELPVSMCLAMNLQQVQFARFGEYRFSITVDDHELATLPFYVLQEVRSKQVDPSG